MGATVKVSVSVYSPGEAPDMSVASVVILRVATGIPPQSNSAESAFAMTVGAESVRITNPLLSSYSTW